MKISIAMASYNGEKFIHKQLKSIINQLDEKDEIIISDNGSSDNTIEIIKSFSDDRIMLLHNPIKGVIKNFENALKNTTGDIIFLSDQDDVWLPQKINTVKKCLENYDLAVSDCMVVDDEENILESSFFKIKKSGVGVIKNLKENTYLGCCMAFTKDLLKLALPFPEKIPMHDIWLGFIADIFFKPCFINDKLVLYRRHSGNASFTAGRSGFSLYQKINFRIQTIRYLPLLLLRKRNLQAV
jgi:glycosyltransferase involved in cell wall biosynthesis